MSRKVKEFDIEDSGIFEWDRMSADAKAFYALDAPVQAFMGGKGNAKTVTAMVKLINAGFAFPYSRYVISRMHKEQLDLVNLHYFNRLVPEGARKMGFTASKSVRITLKATKSEFLFLPAAVPEKLEGIEISAFLLDEAAEKGVQRKAFTTLDSRTRQKGGPNWSILAFNPPPTTHWLHHLCCEDPSYFGKIKVIQGSTYANAHNLPEDYLEKLSRYPKFLRDRFLHGLWGPDIEDLPVFQEFSHDLHIAKEGIKYNSNLPIYRGFDLGYTHPAVLWVQFDKNSVNVLMEYQGSNEVIESVVSKIIPMELKRFGRSAEYINCSGPEANKPNDQTGISTCQRLVSEGFEKKFGFTIPLKIKKSFVDDGLDLIRTTMMNDYGKTGFRIDPSCSHTIEALAGGYHVNENGVPVKDDVYDHLPDCLRYIYVNGLDANMISVGMTEKKIQNDFLEQMREEELIDYHQRQIGETCLKASRIDDDLSSGYQMEFETSPFD